MKTIKVRNLPLDRIGHKTVRLLYDGLPSVKALVHNWYNGDPAFLLRKDSREFLRRLVVRSLREHTWSYDHGVTDYQSVSAPCEEQDVVSFGGTSCDEAPENLVDQIEKASGPFKEINHVTDMFSLCSCCGAEGYELMILKSTVNNQFYGACNKCYECLSTFDTYRSDV